MKKYLVLFLSVTMISSTIAAAEKVDFKKCYKACMKEIDDKDKCTYICEGTKE